MIKQGSGRIINVSGLGAKHVGTTIGSIRNVGVAALTKNLADELAPHGIQAVCVHPGLVRTEATPGVIAAQAKAQGVSEAEIEKRMGSRNLLGKIVTAEEIANVVTFLASSKAIAINGDAIPSGGGTPGTIFSGARGAPAIPNGAMQAEASNAPSRESRIRRRCARLTLMPDIDAACHVHLRLRGNVDRPAQRSDCDDHE